MAGVADRTFPWLPVGESVGDGVEIGAVLHTGQTVQVVNARKGNRTIVLADRDSDAGRALASMSNGAVERRRFLQRRLVVHALPEGPPPVRVGDIPRRPEPLLAPQLQTLTSALEQMREHWPMAEWSTALYLPTHGACLPCPEQSGETTESLILRLLTGGVQDSRLSVEEIHKLNRWISVDEATEFLERFGRPHERKNCVEPRDVPPEVFSLPGRPELESFFREHIIDHHEQRAAYAAMGVRPPGGILLYGPPGSGKSHAAKSLAKYLGWPVFELSLGAVGSSYVHQTAVQLKTVFKKAANAAPALIIIDEFDALASRRESGSHDHKIEEVAELLVLLEGAAEKGIAVVATTNRRDGIDPAFLRKGRFDSEFLVDYPNKEEALAALTSLFSARPCIEGLRIGPVAERLTGRPFSDLAWVVNEAARLAVKSRKTAIDDICVQRAVSLLR